MLQNHNELQVYHYSDTIKVFTDPIGILKAGTGATVWDSALVLAKYLESNIDLNPKNILELGSGTGLLGIIMAKKYPNANVTVSDQLCILPLLQQNIVESGLNNINGKCIDWTSFNESKDYDLIVFSDLIAWPNLYDDLVRVLDLVSGKDSILIFANEKRDFKKEVDFYSKLSVQFVFDYVREDKLDETFQSEDIYVFTAKKKE